MGGVKNLEAECTRMDFDPAFRSTQLWTGKVKFGQPNRAFMKLDKKGGKADDYEQVVCTGQFIYSLFGSSKKAYVFELPKTKQGQAMDGSVLELLFNIKAEEVKKRYAISLGQEDQNYIYIYIQAVTPDDKANFVKARLALRKDNFILRELWFVDGTGNEVQWTIANVKINGPMDVADFGPPSVPRDWTIERNNVQPRVVREKQ